MTHESAEQHPWPAKRWWWLISLVFVTQLGLIFWLGRPQRTVQVPNDVAPSLQLAGEETAKILALNDPTLFALPHLEGFSGEAWLTIPPQEFQPFEWSEPPHWLTLSQEKLGASFKEFAATNQLNDLPVFAHTQFQLKQPELVEPKLFPTQSLLRLTGALAGRRLLVAPSLPSWTNAEILTNSVVQILVGADGLPVSTPTLLKPPGSGPNEADLYALREARKARFEPLSVRDPTDPMAGLTLGQFIFEWYTLPVPVTNNPTDNKSTK
jgi:hypothetical protein